LNSKRQKNNGPKKQGHHRQVGRKPRPVGGELHYAKNHNIVERRIDDTAFLVHPETDTVFYLNQLGTAIWNICAEPVSREEAIQTVQQAFPEVPPKKIAEDVYEFFKQLIKKDFVALCD